MGLKKRNVLLRTPEYFSTNITDCFNFSKSKLTEAVYLSAEGMVQKKSDRELDNMGKLPPWATTWPGGQLTGISRNGRYSSNIGRYERVFGERFVDNSTSSVIFNKMRQQVALEAAQKACGEEVAGTVKRPKSYVTIVATVDLSDSERLKDILKTAMKAIGVAGSSRAQMMKREMDVDFYVERVIQSGFKKNVGAPLHNSALEPSSDELKTLKDYFVGERERVEKLARRPISW